MVRNIDPSTKIMKFAMAKPHAILIAQILRFQLPGLQIQLGVQQEMNSVRFVDQLGRYARQDKQNDPQQPYVVLPELHSYS